MSNKKSENPVVKILMERDGFSLEDAIAEVEAVATEFHENVGDREPYEFYDFLEDAILEDLGLEPDYVLDVLAILDQR